MKTIVTHVSPDLDACTSTWLLRRYLPGWGNAQVVFVNAGSTLNDMDPDEDSETLHVDTGLGKFDHHQTSEKTCAARIVFDYIKAHVALKSKDEEALERLVDYVTLIDNFGEVHFPQPNADIYEFSLPRTIDGLKNLIQNDQKVVDTVLTILDATLISLKNRIHAEKELEEGTPFETKWGKALAVESRNDEVMSIALKNNYRVVIRRDPRTGQIRIKSLPLDHIDLSPVYQTLQIQDPQATWFLHASCHMVLNGSSKNPNSVPSTLPLSQIIAIMREI